MEKTKDAATTQCAEVETKVEKALKTFDALEKGGKGAASGGRSGYEGEGECGISQESTG